MTDHRINVNPSRRFPSEQLRPDVALDNGMLAETRDGGVLQFWLYIHICGGQMSQLRRGTTTALVGYT